MGLLESLRNRGGLLGTVGQTLTDYQQLANAYPNASKFAEGLIKNLSAVAPPDPRNQQQSMQYAINRAFDVPGGFGGAIDVWHGSPHKFDAFDMSKIGTGEGAQAYGHGLYFAENPEVAKSYSSAGGYKTDSPEKIASDLIGMYGGDIEKAVNHLTTILPDHGETTFTGQSRKLVESALASIKDGTYKNAESNLYKTSLQWPDAAKETSDPLGPQHFLDWDKPLSEQPESVQKVAQAYNATKTPSGLKEAKGSHVYQTIANALKQPPFDSVSPGSVQGSNYLKELGIPGIRYLDGGSRGAGDGSYNYVVFDDQIPRILERNGIGLLNSLKR